jgi:hypothetical protein
MQIGQSNLARGLACWAYALMVVRSNSQTVLFHYLHLSVSYTFIVSWVIFVLILSDITSEVRTITLLLIVDLQRTFHAELFMIPPRHFEVPSSGISLAIATKPKAKYRRHASAMLFAFSLQNGT